MTIWSNRSWKRLLHQNASFLLGICSLHWWKQQHTLFWLHFPLLSHDGLFVREREFGPSHSWNSKHIPVKVKQWVFVNLFLLFSIFDFFWQTFLLDGLWTSLRCYEVMNDLLCERAQKHEVETIGVNFFAEYHGKSAVDSHVSHISRAVSQWIVTEHLTNIDDLKKAITSYFEQSKTSVTVKIIQLPQNTQNNFFFAVSVTKNWTWQKIMRTQIIKIKLPVLLRQKSTVLGKNAK